MKRSLKAAATKEEEIDFYTMTHDFAITTKSADETQRFGKEFAKKLSGGNVVSLYGDLGSGKTQIVKAFASDLVSHKPLTIPIIVNEYSSEQFPKFSILIYTG
jgi:tRNA threonylcarbamoyladenosine biosynthesis protein TsaE